MALSLSASQQSIQQLFETSEQYVIPDFQRPYLWEYDECFQLYTDLTSAFHRNREEYFLGSVLLARGKDNNKQPIIIDGQQRIVTIWIIMKVLSEMYPDYVTFPKLLKVNLSLRENKMEPKILSNVQEVEDWKEINFILDLSFDMLLDAVYSESGEVYDRLQSTKIGTSVLMFFLWFNDYRMRDVKELEDFCDYLLECVFMLPIELKEDTAIEAQDRTLTIFETLNNRGRELDDAYIFKARLYSMAKNMGKAEEFSNEWSSINDSCKLLHIKLDELFRYYSHIIRAEKGITTSEVRLREFFTGSENTPLLTKGVDVVMSDLNKIIDILFYLEQLRRENSFNTRWLQILDAYSNVYPKYALVVYLYFRGMNDVRLAQFMQDLIKLCYLYGSSSSVKFQIYTLIKNIYTEGPTDLYLTYEGHFSSIVSVPRRLRNGLLLLLLYLQFPDKILLSYTIKRHYNYATLEKMLPPDMKPKNVESGLENNYIKGRMVPIGKESPYPLYAEDLQPSEFTNAEELARQQDYNQTILADFFFSLSQN